MNKSKFLNNIVDQKSNIALVCVLGMIGGFLVSRALSSMGIIGFGIIALFNINPREWFRHKWWLLGCGWIAAYAISYFWSADKGYWDTTLQVKLPILLLPVSFALLPKFSVKQLQVFMIAVSLMLLAGACYSVSFLIRNWAYYIHEYGSSQMLPTPAKSDHIRFSMCIALFVIWCIYFWKHISGWMRWFAGITITLLIIYLHILAAKSGLITLYAFFVLWGINIAMNKQRVLGIGIIIGLAVFITFAVKNIPTLSRRLDYIKYNYDMYRNGDRTGQFSDLSRLISYDVALKLIAQHPWIGVGVGDIPDDMKTAYRRYYPQIEQERQILPHNQLLTVTVGCGIPVGILFLIWSLAPLTWLRRRKERIFLIAAWFGIFLQLMIEPVLEVQYGVFVYLFFLLWFKYTLVVEDKMQECRPS